MLCGLRPCKIVYSTHNNAVFKNRYLNWIYKKCRLVKKLGSYILGWVINREKQVEKKIRHNSTIVNIVQNIPGSRGKSILHLHIEHLSTNGNNRSTHLSISYPNNTSTKNPWLPKGGHFHSMKFISNNFKTYLHQFQRET